MASTKNSTVNNDIYHHYGERWYTADDDPVALLRAEARARTGWIISEMARRFPAIPGVAPPRILDIGCGAGFLSNELAQQGYRITGVDSAEQALAVARRHDATGSVDYRSGDATRLEFADGAFDAVCAMDFLEHVEAPGDVVREAARVLKPNGLFFFYTFNRNPLSWLVIIKGVEWFVRNTPRNMHALRYFIKPQEMKRMCLESGLELAYFKGLSPRIWQASFWRMLATGRVDPSFSFKFTHHTLLGFVGLATRSHTELPYKK
jgi:2-polyprenyl-6-hydroxyphenyl methylase/3-demethylubiquinone-9 3-methyltransferase